MGAAAPSPHPGRMDTFLGSIRPDTPDDCDGTRGRRTGAVWVAGTGAFLLLAAAAAGELASFDVGRVSARSLLAVAYLVTFGSLVGFSAYVWLLGVSTPARVATYAYVNPVVAVLLGWALAGEAITPRMLVASAVIIGAVAVITTAGDPAAPAAESGEFAVRRADTRPADHHDVTDAA